MDPIQTLLARLAAHQPFDDDEARGRATLTAFVSTTPEPFARATLSGHVTGSAMVVAPDGRCLLLHHARLDIWVQPGGHLEPGETDPANGALREAREETGLADLELERGPYGAPLLFDVDVHPIPASEKRGEPAHFHHDLCFVTRTRVPADAAIDPHESHALRWVGPEDLAGLTLDTATRRRLRKVFSRASNA